jgi:hypothetical protein
MKRGARSLREVPSMKRSAYGVAFSEADGELIGDAGAPTITG